MQGHLCHLPPTHDAAGFPECIKVYTDNHVVQHHICLQDDVTNNNAYTGCRENSQSLSHQTMVSSVSRKVHSGAYSPSAVIWAAHPTTTGHSSRAAGAAAPVAAVA
jgi:hypothetical protein